MTTIHKNPLLVKKSVAAQHCLRKTPESKDSDPYNITCVKHGIRPAAILHNPTADTLQDVLDLKLQVLPVLLEDWQQHIAHPVVVYDPSRPSTLGNAKVLAMLGTGDDRMYSPQTHEMYVAGAKCYPGPFGESTQRLDCVDAPDEWKQAQPFLYPEWIVGTMLGYDPHAVEAYTLRSCLLKRAKNEQVCREEGKEQQKEWQKLLQDPNFWEKTVNWYLQRSHRKKTFPSRE